VVRERFVTIGGLNVWRANDLIAEENLGTFHLSTEEQMIEVRMHNVEGLCPVDCNTSTKIASQMLAAASIGALNRM
jgi:hypothetical protein